MESWFGDSPIGIYYVNTIRKSIKKDIKRFKETLKVGIKFDQLVTVDTNRVHDQNHLYLFVLQKEHALQ